MLLIYILMLWLPHRQQLYLIYTLALHMSLHGLVNKKSQQSSKGDEFDLPLGLKKFFFLNRQALQVLPYPL